MKRAQSQQRRMETTWHLKLDIARFLCLSFILNHIKRLNATTSNRPPNSTMALIISYSPAAIKYSLKIIFIRLGNVQQQLVLRSIRPKNKRVNRNPTVLNKLQWHFTEGKQQTSKLDNLYLNRNWLIAAHTREAPHFSWNSSTGRTRNENELWMRSTL